MKPANIRKEGRSGERVGLLLISAVLGLLFFQLFQVLKRDFSEVPQRLADGSMVNLNSGNLPDKMSLLLTKGFYFEDPRDVALIRNRIAQEAAKGGKKVDNIGELNKSAYFVNAEEAFSRGGQSFQKRVKTSRGYLGFAGDDSLLYAKEKSAPLNVPQQNHLAMGDGNITVRIANGEGAPAGGVLVVLNMLLPQDSLYSDEVSETIAQQTETTASLRKRYATDGEGHRQLTALTAYARTDAAGECSFTGLSKGKAFEVLPLQPGFQFGASKGVQELKGSKTFRFTQSPHQIRLFATKDFNNLRKEKALIVRTPEEVTNWYYIISAIFFGGFFLLHLLLSVRFPQADGFVLPVVMLLTGLSLLTLLSLQDPLRDRFLARSMSLYLAGGFGAIFLLLLFDLKRFTIDSGFYRQWIFRGPNGAKGLHWALLAAMLLLMTYFFGSGPQGSGVRVNLFGFQPSEVVKFFVVLFLAGFFTANERFLAEYATVQKRWKFFWLALACIVSTILLFLLVGDLGPAIVVCFTFIVLFSFARGDFAWMAGTVLLFVLSNWLLKNVWLATGITVVISAVLMLFVRKQMSESSVMALVVMAGFLLLDQIPFLSTLFEGQIQRLTDRKAIWLNPWDNEVFGGDQIANGIWAMSSGGVQGQGIGEGFAKTIPEAHTDMILPSLGEDLGWAGIVSVFILFFIYFHRALQIGRQSGRSFLFYLSAGIGISTFVQFLLIAGGSVGALPLSGVSLPFVSYGGSSLLMNMVAAGFLLSASVMRGSVVQMEYVSARQDKNLMPALTAACVGLILLTVTVSRYLFNNEKWVVEPALVAERSGARMFSYNPRIAILVNRLQAGELYDRNGLLLATSKPQMVAQRSDTLMKVGIAPSELQSLIRKRQDRYYPFGAQTFFWTGDANTGVFMGGSNGYFGEYRHDTELRGFATPEVSYNVVASRYRENRFLPRALTEMVVTKRDYSALSHLLLAGINSAQVDSFRNQNRDVHMSMDAALQTALQQSFAKDDSLADNRVSVVVLEDSTGDVLASAMYPLPPVNNWDRLTLPLNPQLRQDLSFVNSDLGFTYATQPGSTAKLATALAAFNKLGMAAAEKKIVVRPQDLIRIKSNEPDEAGTISMERAIVKSNNAYFIKLANEERLQEEMAALYLQTGMFLRGVGGYFYNYRPNNTEQEKTWMDLWRKTEFASLRRYNPNDIRKTRGLGVSGMAWGQGELVATPAAIARLASGIAHNGKLMPHRFVLRFADSATALGQPITIAKDAVYAAEIKKYMLAQSATKVDDLGMQVAGKTGTPERILNSARINDGWYVFFAPKANGGGNIIVCVRTEKAKGSSEAVRLAGKHVIPVLKRKGYLE
jgi:cell division protein FtsW (lipid II flippase)